MLTIGTFLSQAQNRLTTAGVDSARLDSLILLEDVLGKDRAHLLAHPNTMLSSAQLAKLNTFVMQRERHLPLAYIRAKANFYGREFAVSRRTLVPRPETEAIITLLLGIKELPAHPFIVDIGTGSGCIGITAKLELPDAQVCLTDIDAAVLRVARANARKHKAAVEIKQASLLKGMSDSTKIDVILVNLPYVPQHYPINQAAGFEPSLALFSGSDGLDAYRELWAQVGLVSSPPPHILMESLSFQHHALALLARHAGYVLEQTDGLVQHFTSWATD